MNRKSPRRTTLLTYGFLSAYFIFLALQVPARAEYFSIDFRWKPTASNLVNCDFCILDIQAAPDLGPGHAAGKKFFSYMSVGQIAGDAPYLADVLARGIKSVSYNAEWNSYYPDLSDPRWADYVVWHLAPIALNKGFDGFFLDTVDAVETLSALQPNRAQAHRNGMINIIRGLKNAYPNKEIILNRGFAVFDSVKTSVKGMLVEELFQRDDYTARSADGVAQLLARIQPVRDAGLPVYVVDYVPPSNLALADTTAERISNLGFHPLIVPQALHGIILAPRRPTVGRPADASVWAGNACTFTATANGTPPMAYQWYCNGNMLLGAQGSSLVLPNVAMAHAGAYSVTVRNAAGLTASAAATLSVQMLDGDRDNMPDDWERQHGLLPTHAGDAFTDADNDRISNLDEYRSGTNPRDARSGLKLQIGRPVGNRVSVFLPAVASYSYSIELKSTRGDGSWFKLHDVPAHTTNRTVQVEYTFADPASAYLFRAVTPNR